MAIYFYFGIKNLVAGVSMRSIGRLFLYLTIILLVSCGSEPDSVPLDLPAITTSDVTNVSATAAKGGGNITNNGGSAIAFRGVCWSTSHSPTVDLPTKTNDGIGLGSFESVISNLESNTQYFVRAYAINEKGTSYGEEISFKTRAVAPVITTNEITNITISTASGGGTIVSDGGSAIVSKGICWDTNPNPVVTLGTKTNDGQGPDNFTSSLNNLSGCTTYYVRAFATNAEGTSYGNEISFTTIAGAPTVATNEVILISSGTATAKVSVTDGGGGAVLSRGVCWSVNPNPTVDTGSKSTNGTGLGDFDVLMVGLLSDTEYYARAYANNCSQTTYGAQLVFKTESIPTVTIGTQVWMLKNLNVDYYLDGSLIPTNLNDAQWSTTTAGASAAFNNDSYFSDIYGKLYNWYAVADPRGLCPAGFHVPTKDEWTTLANFLGGASTAGGKMKETGTTQWYTPNTGATNSSGFTGLPAGNRYSDGLFTNLSVYGAWWSSTLVGPNIFRVALYTGEVYLDMHSLFSDKNPGISIRCIKD